MLNYTRAAGRKIGKDLRMISTGLSIAAQLLSIVYLFYIVLFGSGIFAIKLTLLILSFAYFLFFCIATAYSAKKELKRKITLFYQWSKRAIKIVNLAVIIYGFANAEHTTLSLMLLSFSILGWALDLVIGVISFVCNAWLQLLFEGIEADVEEIKKPITSAQNFFKKVTGQAVPDPAAPTKNREMLNDMVAKEREEKAIEKQQAKLEQLKLRVQAKQEKRAKKLQAKEEKKAKKLPATDVSEETATSKDE